MAIQACFRVTAHIGDCMDNRLKQIHKLMPLIDDKKARQELWISNLEK